MASYPFNDEAPSTGGVKDIASRFTGQSTAQPEAVFQQVRALLQRMNFSKCVAPKQPPVARHGRKRNTLTRELPFRGGSCTLALPYVLHWCAKCHAYPMRI